MHNWIDRYVECTSASIQGLALFKKLYPGHRRKEVYNCIRKGADFIESIQRNDGSWWVLWHHESYFIEVYNLSIVTTLHALFLICISNRYGSWGVCFTHATWFAVRGLVCAGRTFENSLAIKKACKFILSKELPSGGWGESYLSCQDKVTWLQSTCLFILNKSFLTSILTINMWFYLLQHIYHLQLPSLSSFPI